MPITRSVYERRDGSCIVTLPKSWVDNIKEKYGKKKLTTVYMEIFNEKIVISPKIDNRSEKFETKEKEES